MYYIPSILGGSVAIAVLWKAVFSVDGLLTVSYTHLGVLSLESLQSALVSSVTAVAAPPANAQVDGAVRQCQAPVSYTHLIYFRY